jgi:hypothetical protein
MAYGRAALYQKIRRSSKSDEALNLAQLRLKIWGPRGTLGAGRRPDTVEFADRQSLDERQPHLRRDDVLAVRLAVIGGELRQ